MRSFSVVNNSLFLSNGIFIHRMSYISFQFSRLIVASKHCLYVCDIMVINDRLKIIKRLR